MGILHVKDQWYNQHWYEFLPEFGSLLALEPC